MAHMQQSQRCTLIVEDDYAIRDMMTTILEEEGYDVQSVGDGQEALDILRSGTTRPGLVLLDIWMPRLNGWQFLGEVQHDPVLASIPIIVMSADRMMGDRIVGTCAKAYVPKPIPLDTLLDVVAQYCS